MTVYPVELYDGCPCYACDQAPRIEAATNWLDTLPNRMSLCPACGDKRCPGALDHTQHPEVMPGPVRWKVACINWSYPDAPHAMAYAVRDDVMVADWCFDTWAEALTFADQRARGVWIRPVGQVAP